VFEYRFLATGSIEEKVYQRQLSKEGLQGGLFESELQVLLSALLYLPSSLDLISSSSTTRSALFCFWSAFRLLRSRPDLAGIHDFIRRTSKTV
jgi:hypothetical protein